MYTETRVAETSGSLRPPIASHEAPPGSDSEVSDAECAMVLQTAMDNDTLAEPSSNNKRKH
jgi:hypothetical protein